MIIVRGILQLIPLLVLGTFAYLWHHEVALGKESLSWPTTKARVNEASYGGRRDRLSYSFSVGETQFKGYKLEFCKVADKDLQEYFANNINNRKEITISYRPSDPSISVARPGIDDRQSTGYYILSAFAFVIAIAMERIYRIYFKKRKEESYI